MQDKSQVFQTDQLPLFPARPGVYIMKDDAGKIIYIGKAKNIRTRLRTYFSRTGDGRFSVLFFLPRIRRIETIVTNNEKEAFLLENILIKKHQPRYNIRLRDDKTYISLRINTNKTFPRLEWVRKRKKDGSLYFGPYSSSHAVRNTVRFLEKIFPLRTCTDNVMKNRSRPCIRYQINRCLAPCCKSVSPEEYQKLVNGVVLYLRGNMGELKKRLSGQMEESSEKLRFEKAAAIRDRIAAINATIEKQSISHERARDLDVIAHYDKEGVCCITTFQYRMGVLAGTRTFFFKRREQTIPEIYHAFFGQYYTGDNFIPPLILVEQKPDQKPLLEESFSDIRGASVSISRPVRGRKASLVRLARENAREHLTRKLEGERDLSLVLQSLQKKLNLPEIPAHIEGFDISNIQGRLAVGSMVVFRDGKPDNSSYRQYKIQTVSGSDDFAMIYEVVLRRYRRLLEEDRSFPHLILIDGGKGQLNAALRALNELNLRGLSIAGIAKSRLKSDRKQPEEKKPTGERIFLPGRKNPVVLKPGSPALFLIQQIRDEAHRFAVTYHKKLRSKKQKRSILDEIPGIGPGRKKSLLKHFGSLSAVKSASLEQLTGAPGMSSASAENVYYFFHPRYTELAAEEETPYQKKK